MIAHKWDIAIEKHPRFLYDQAGRRADDKRRGGPAAGNNHHVTMADENTTGPVSSLFVKNPRQNTH